MGADRLGIPEHGNVNRYQGHGCRCDDCRAAYARYRRSLRAEGRAKRKVCTVEACDATSVARSLCPTHYARWHKEQNPDAWRAKSRRGTARRRALKVAGFVEEVDIDYLLERDNWVCQICRKRIPRSARYPDLRSPSLDHIVPLGHGGRHEKSNCQAVHLGCNVRKGDRGTDQLRLLG